MFHQIQNYVKVSEIPTLYTPKLPHTRAFFPSAGYGGILIVSNKSIIIFDK